MDWKRTYKMEQAPVPAMEWDEYERRLLTVWERLLDGEAASSEASVQEFLERHPCLVPGAFNILGGESGHYPWYTALISQPILPSYNHRVPDFMWLSKNSEMEEPVLIEIEAPSKRWFTKTKPHRQTESLTRALDQIAEWKKWFDVPRNVEAFKAFYGLDREAWRGKRFRPAYVLIYGRRSEANATPELTGKRGHLHPDDVVLMTYDRLRPNADARQLVSTSVDKTGTFRVISVPPTLKWSPSLAHARAHLTGFEEAIRANSWIPPERQTFLIRRLTYWNEWATASGRGPINAADAE